MSSSLMGRKRSEQRADEDSEPPGVEVVPVPPLILLPQEAAELLSLSERSVAALVRGSSLPARRTPGGLLFSDRRLRGWLGEQIEDIPLIWPALDTAGAARFLRRSPDTVRTYVRDPRLRLPVREVPGGFRFSAEALRGWVEGG